jgi:nucleoside-diphosphate-sugar epimerase
LAAENVLSKHPFGANRVILRLAGIYGPDRIPRLADLKQNKTIAVNGGSYINLIHVDDASEIVLASVDVSGPNLILVADGVPVLRRDFYEYAAKLLGVQVEFTEVLSDASARQRSEGGKRCRVDRMKGEFDYELRFPTFRHGLADILGR